MTNYSFAIWIGLSAVMVLLFLYAAFINLRRQRLPEIQLDQIIPSLQPVDLEALTHLSVPAESRNLRQDQIRAAAQYLHRMARNAALLQRIGYGQINSPNPLLAAQAQELIDAGVHVRLYAFMGLALLFFWRFFPVPLLAPQIFDMKKLMLSSLFPAYEMLKGKAQNLTAFRDTDFREALLQGL